MAGRRVVSGDARRPDAASTAETPKGRSVRSASSSDPARANHSNPGEFVDVRWLEDDDVVGRTLKQTSGVLGVATRPKVVDFRARLKERRKANVRLIMVRVAAAIGSVAAVAAVMWLLLFSPVFRLEPERIAITGANEWVSEQQVMQIAGKQAGKSLFLVSSNEVIDQLDDIPGVTEAKVDKRFPKTLQVTVRAQRPAAMLRTPDNTMTAVDSKGRVLNSVEGASVEGIPVVDVDDVEQALADRAVQETLAILGGLDESLRQRVSGVSAQTQDSITTVLDGGNYTIAWGDSSDLELKKAVVDKIINDPDVIGDKHQVDVSAPMRPIIK